MTSNAIDQIQTRAVAAPGRVGQATAVEQSRAIAEVHAAVIVAQQVPRSTSAAINQMTEACQMLGMAQRAFFRYNRGEGMVNGATVHLARELGRCWGNIQYGIHELRRDDEARQSEMQAWAWDVQTNARTSTTFIVPHIRDSKKGPKVLVDQRDIYENNANMGARRLREQIFAVLPRWFIDQAEDLCRATLERGESGRTPAQRAADHVRRFGELGVSQAQLEAKLERPVDSWTPQDLATLSVIGRSLAAGEVQRDDEFEPERVTAAEIVDQPAAARPPRQRSASKAEAAPVEPPFDPDAEQLAELAADEAADRAGA